MQSGKAAVSIIGAALVVTLVLALSCFGTARAQTMGEYGGTVAHAAGAGVSAGSLPAPAAHMNPAGAPKTVVVQDDSRDQDDDSYSTPDQKEDSASNDHDDEWTQVK